MHYCISLSRRLKLTLAEFFEKMTIEELDLQMAYDLTEQDSFKQKMQEEREAEEFAALSPDEQSEIFMRILGGGK